MGQRSNSIPDNPVKKQIITILDEEVQIFSYKSTTERKYLLWIITILTLGFARLLLHWYKEAFVKLMYIPCDNTEADVVMMKDSHQVCSVKNVHHITANTCRPLDNGTYENINYLKYFIYRKIKYVYYEKIDQWINPADIDSDAPFNIFIKSVKDDEGLSPERVEMFRTVYGRNSLRVELTPYLKILLMEVLTPFYIFQLFSVILWYSDHYQYYATVIVIITSVSAVIEVRNTRVQEVKVRNMVGSSQMISVLRSGTFVEIDAEELVPGDIYQVPSHKFILPCDALLVNGSAIVNESMLTGESVPVTKVPLTAAEHCSDSVRFSSEKHNRHTLFCGTTVIQTRFYGGKPVLARVVRTGFSTLKGQLVRSIMYPKPMDPQYMKDLFLFILLLACIAGCGFVYTITIMILRESTFVEILIKSLDIITIVVPPALPAAMSIGVINACRRLQKQLIFCISPSTLNVCGQIQVMCFDKTGTLTEDGLNFSSLRALKRVEGKPEFTDEYEALDPNVMQTDGANLDIITAAAACQSLTRIDGQLHGDPLDLILFEKSKWVIEEPAEGKYETMLFDNVQPTILRPAPEHSIFHKGNGEYVIIRQFPFSSALQRMSVIVTIPSEDTAHEVSIYAKGSPEMIMSLCNSASVPKNYMDIVNNYAQSGYRLIAVASKTIELNFARAMKAPRDMLESDLDLLGLIVMENKLKDVTLQVINELFLANIRAVMVTGDNLLTAMSVARESGIVRPYKKAFLITHDSSKQDHCGRTQLMIQESVSSSEAEIDTDSQVRAFDKKLHLQPSKYHLAISGPTYAVMANEYPELIDQLTAVCDVYARMAPDQKAALITALQEIGCKVGMCGDGANDCAALKTADAGISLSEAEASIAAPFTSNIQDIRCVPKVIREGRCALVTSFAIFKYMAAYSLNEFLSVMYLYWISSNVSDGQFLCIDMFLITLVALTLGNTGPSDTLSSIPPPSRLATLSSVFSVIGQLTINTLHQLIVFVLTRSQPWYNSDLSGEEDTTSYEGTSLFTATSFVYLGLGFVYSKGAPYRKSVLTNYLLCIIVVVIGTITLVMVLVNWNFINWLMGFDPIPKIGYRLFLIGTSAICIAISIIYEHVFVQGFVATYIEKKRRARKLCRHDPSLPAYERILHAIREDPQWFEDGIKKPSHKLLNESTTTKF